MLNSGDMPLLRCAHISDLHFSHPTWTLSQFFSKRWVGNANLLFSRKKEYIQDHFHALIDLFKEKGISHVFITGDLSCTSLDLEFQKAQQFIHALQTAGCQVFQVPGNHDQYTKKAYRSQAFYSFFPSPNLQKDKVAAHKIADQWWIVALDTALSTPLFSASGLFSQDIEQALRHLLTEIPKHHHILLMNHFPLFAQPSLRNSLHRSDALRTLIEQFPNIRFYLHGHTHRHAIADLRKNGLPIILDSGSIAHIKRSSWNYLEIDTDHARVVSYHKNPTQSWNARGDHRFIWSAP